MTTAPSPAEKELLSYMLIVFCITKIEINVLKVHSMVGYTFLYKKSKKECFFGKSILNAVFF